MSNYLAPGSLLGGRVGVAKVRLWPRLDSSGWTSVDPFALVLVLSPGHDNGDYALVLVEGQVGYVNVGRLQEVLP